MVTYGPFLLESWAPGERMVLTRNPDYHGSFAGNLQQVMLLHSDLTPGADLEKYHADRSDYVNLSFLPIDELDRVRRHNAGEYATWPVPSTGYLVIDASRPPFDDVRVRRALALSMNRETLAEEVLKGFFSPATGGFVPPGIPGHSPGIGLPYDPDQARRLVAQAGYAGGAALDFPIVRALANRGRATWARWLQAQWRDVLGIEIPWEVVEWETFRRRSKRLEHLHITSWRADYPDPDYHLRLGANQWRDQWWDETYQRLVEKARSVADPNEREGLYQQAERILIEEAAIVPLTYSRSHVLIKPWVGPISAIRDGLWKDVILKTHSGPELQVTRRV